MTHVLNEQMEHFLMQISQHESLNEEMVRGKQTRNEMMLTMIMVMDAAMNEK